MKFLKWLNDGWKWLRGSADNLPGGASSKKLTGFWLVAVVSTGVVATWCAWAYRNGDWSMMPIVLSSTISAGLIALGINAWEKNKGVANTGEAPTNDKDDE